MKSTNLPADFSQQCDKAEKQAKESGNDKALTLVNHARVAYNDAMTTRTATDDLSVILCEEYKRRAIRKLEQALNALDKRNVKNKTRQYAYLLANAVDVENRVKRANEKKEALEAARKAMSANK